MAVEPLGLLLLGSTGPSTGLSSVAVSVCMSVGLLVLRSQVATATLLLPEETCHLPARVSGPDVGPSWCWMQAVVSDLGVVVSHKSGSVADIQFGETEGVKQFSFSRQVRPGSGSGLAHNHLCRLVCRQYGLDAGHQSLACILCVCCL